jgi:hypothetical protein
MQAASARQVLFAAARGEFLMIDGFKRIGVSNKSL